MNILIYFLFNWVIILTGRGFSILVKKILNKNIALDTVIIFNHQLFFIYPLLGLFIIGNISFIGNFFIPVDNILFKILFLFLILINLSEKINIRNIRLFITNTFSIPLLLFFSTYSVNLAQDAGLYQLNSQLWIKSTRTVIGLSNLHSRYGYSSISEYIGANFWLESNLILLHFASLIFITFFFTFLVNNLHSSSSNFLKYSSVSIIFMGVFDNFGFGGGRNGFIDIDAVMKQDTAFAILFFYGSISIINLIINQEFTLLNIFYASLIILFSIQLRIFGFVILIIFLYYLFLSTLNGLKLTHIFIYVSPAVLLLTAWTIKNIMISGCMVYPVEFTCFESLYWYENGYASAESNDLRIFHMAYGVGDNVFLWLEDWMQKATNINPLKNFIVTFLVIILFNKMYFKKTYKGKFINRHFIIYGYVSVAFLLWVLSAPSTRFGIGIYLLFICLIYLDIDRYNARYKISKFLLNSTMIFMVFLSIFMLNRSESYQIFLNNPLSQKRLISTSVSYKPNTLGWGVTPTEGSSCWINIDCIPVEKKIDSRDGFYHSFFIES